MSDINPESFLNLDNARSDEQRRVMESIKDEGFCPFCPEHLKKNHQPPILRKGDHWVVTPNQWPYANTRNHLLAIATYHAESLAELQPGAFEELQEHFVWAETEFRIAAGGIAMRFGDTRRSGATVSHIHAHLIDPLPDLAKEDKVRFKIS